MLSSNKTRVYCDPFTDVSLKTDIFPITVGNNIPLKTAQFLQSWWEVDLSKLSVDTHSQTHTHTYIVRNKTRLHLVHFQKLLLGLRVSDYQRNSRLSVSALLLVLHRKTIYVHEKLKTIYVQVLRTYLFKRSITEAWNSAYLDFGHWASLSVSTSNHPLPCKNSD